MKPISRATRFAAALMLSASAAAHADIGTTVREIVENQRRILILREAADGSERAEVRRAGQYLFFRNQQLGRKLVDETAPASADAAARYRELAAAIDDPAYDDEDRLVLRGPLETLARKLPADERRDAARRLARLADLRKQLGGSFDAVLQRIPLRQGHGHGSRWAAYLERISAATGARQILEMLEQELVAAAEPVADRIEAAARARVLEWNGDGLPERSILLTFDDGPHAIHTPAVLDVLKAHAVHAVFFAVGRNLGEVRHGAASPGPSLPVVERLLREGHAVGNHSYTHPVLPKLDQQAVAREIEDTQTLIESMVPDGAGRTAGFRAPYGARDDKVLALIDLHHLRSIVWNIDSDDWADPLPESIAHRVIREAERAGRGIVLMHDIHARSVEALPIVIRELRKRGFRFARWDGRKLAVEPDPPADRASPVEAASGGGAP